MTCCIASELRSRLVLERRGGGRGEEMGGRNGDFHSKELQFWTMLLSTELERAGRPERNERGNSPETRGETYDLPSVGHLHHCFKAILSDRVDLRKCACV